jgi:hypothetical protein
MVKVIVDRAAVVARLENAFKASLPMLSEEILNDCNKYCKEDSRTLIRSSLLQSLPKEGRLIWQTPYAKRQYWEIRTAIKDKNPSATWRWCEKAKRENIGKWTRQAQVAFKMQMGG